MTEVATRQNHVNFHYYFHQSWPKNVTLTSGKKQFSSKLFKWFVIVVLFLDEKKTCKPAKVLIDKCQWGRKVIYLRGRKHMRTFLVILFFLSIMCFRMCSLILQCPLFCKCLTDNNHFVWMVQSHTSFLKGWTSKDIFSISTASWTEYLVTTANATAHDRQGKDYYHLVLGCCCALRKVPR